MPDSISCANCGVDLTDFHRDSERMPCPNCEATARRFGVSIHETIKVSDYIAALHERNKKAIGFSESARQRRASAADQMTSDSQTFQIEGTAPQREEDTLLTCRILVRKWNEDGEAWAEPTEGQDDVDCRAESTSDSRTVAQIQVVRAIIDPTLWKTLSVSGRVRIEEIRIGKLADWLKESIEKKAKRMPTPRRAQLHIALDATRLPGLGFDDVAGYFLNRYGPWAAALGFASIWLVGPSTRLTWRLDLRGKCQADMIILSP
jgi:hypothetical protein